MIVNDAESASAFVRAWEHDHRARWAKRGKDAPVKCESLSRRFSDLATSMRGCASLCLDRQSGEARRFNDAADVLGRASARWA